MDDKKERPFMQLMVRKDTRDRMLNFKKTHGKKISHNDIINYLFLLNNKRIREDICSRWINEGDIAAAEELIENINDYTSF